MSAKHQPAGAFGGKKRLTPAPDTAKHPMASAPAPAPAAAPEPASTPEAKRVQFSARMDADLLRRIKKAAIDEGINLQVAADRAFSLWLESLNAQVKER